MPIDAPPRQARSTPNRPEERAMSLFKREKSAGTPCPRCSQLVSDGSGDVCPMCGWDVREAYQGPATSPQADESAADPRVV
jgi:hypothetical protein